MEDDIGHSLINKILSYLKKKPHLGKGSDLAEEIHDLMDEGQAKGLITGEESEMVHGVLDLKETTVHSIMIPRMEISSASIDATLGEIIELVTRCGHTRIPIYKDHIDEIVGILHAKDLLKLMGKDPGTRIPPDILRRPYFVHRNKKVSELLRELKEQKTHLAIVTDEYGGTAGIITTEDIIEEIVGEIEDEHDNNAPLLSVIDEYSTLISARMKLEKLEEHLAMKLPEGDYESVGGFVIELMNGQIPQKGQKIHFKDLEITIKSADERKIDKVLITRTPPANHTLQDMRHH
ncbi:MAG: HlyC/CorC family transporter [Deltaproteobacteria bacterium]|nr:HlyC/CorC family transporter [Deltaproteobacteria bacterium]